MIVICMYKLNYFMILLRIIQDRLVSKNHFDAVSLCEGKNLILEVYGRTAGLARYSGLVVFYFYFVVTILNKIFYLT